MLASVSPTARVSLEKVDQVFLRLGRCISLSLARKEDVTMRQVRLA